MALICSCGRPAVAVTARGLPVCAGDMRCPRTDEVMAMPEETKALAAEAAAKIADGGVDCEFQPATVRASCVTVTRWIGPGVMGETEVRPPTELRPPPEHEGKKYHWLLDTASGVAEPWGWWGVWVTHGISGKVIVGEHNGYRYLGPAEWREPDAYPTAVRDFIEHQFPEIVEQKDARIAELEGLLAAAHGQSQMLRERAMDLETAIEMLRGCFADHDFVKQTVDRWLATVAPHEKHYVGDMVPFERVLMTVSGVQDGKAIPAPAASADNSPSGVKADIERTIDHLLNGRTTKDQRKGLSTATERAERVPSGGDAAVGRAMR